MAVEKDNDGDEEAEREGVVGFGLVGLVKCVGFGEFPLVVLQLFLLFGREDSQFFFLLGLRSNGGGVGRGFDIEVGGTFVRKVVFVVQFWESLFSSQSPCEMMIMSNENHVVCIDGSKRSKPIANDGKEGYKHIVYNINNVVSTTSNIDPTWSQISMGMT